MFYKSEFNFKSLVESKEPSTLEFREYYKKLPDVRALSHHQIWSMLVLLYPQYLKDGEIINGELRNRLRKTIESKCTGTARRPLLNLLNYLLFNQLMTEKRWNLFFQSPEYRQTIYLLISHEAATKLEQYDDIEECKSILEIWDLVKTQKTTVEIWDLVRMEKATVLLLKTQMELKKQMELLLRLRFNAKQLAQVLRAATINDIPLHHSLNFIIESQQALEWFCNTVTSRQYLPVAFFAIMGDFAEIITQLPQPKSQSELELITDIIYFCDKAHLNKEAIVKLSQSKTVLFLHKLGQEESLNYLTKELLEHLTETILHNDEQAYQIAITLMQFNNHNRIGYGELRSQTILSFSSAGTILQAKGWFHWVNDLLVQYRVHTQFVAALIVELDLAGLLTKANIQSFLDNSKNFLLLPIIKVLNFQGLLTQQYYERVIHRQITLEDGRKFITSMDNRGALLKILDNIPVRQKKSFTLSTREFHQRRQQFLEPRSLVDSPILATSGHNESLIEQLERCLDFIHNASLPLPAGKISHPKITYAVLNFLQQKNMLTEDLYKHAVHNPTKIWNIIKLLGSLNAEQRNFLNEANIRILINHPNYAQIAQDFKKIRINRAMVLNLLCTHGRAILHDALAIHFRFETVVTTSFIARDTSCGQLLAAHSLYDEAILNALLHMHYDFYLLEQLFTRLAKATPCLLHRDNLNLIIEKVGAIEGLVFVVDCLAHHNLLNQPNFEKCLDNDFSLLKRFRLLDLIYRNQLNQQTLDALIEQDASTVEQTFKQGLMLKYDDVRQTTRLDSKLLCDLGFYKKDSRSYRIAEFNVTRDESNKDTLSKSQEFSIAIEYWPS